MSAEPEARTFRTIFISDVHLGSKAAKADYLIDFMRYHEAETYILVGDIIDGWRLKRSWHWPQSCNDVVQKLLRKARKGARIIYVPGNHDEFLRDFPGMHFGGIEVALNWFMKPPTARNISSSTATNSTSSCAITACSPISATGPMMRPFS